MKIVGGGIERQREIWLGLLQRTERPEIFKWRENEGHRGWCHAKGNEMMDEERSRTAHVLDSIVLV